MDAAGRLLASHPTPDWATVLEHEQLPLPVVDLGALRRNREAVISALGDRPIRVRLATRAIRSTALLRHLLMAPAHNPRGRAVLQGVACDSVSEALALLDLGFDDILLPAPIVTAEDAARVAEKVAGGAYLIPTVDCREHVALLSRAAAEAGTEIGVCIDVDVSWHPAADVRFGRFRSSLSDVHAARELGQAIAGTPGVRVVGVSAWESQVADAWRPEARRWWKGPFHGWMNARSSALAADRRVAVVESLKADGHAISIVNGGSSATLPVTAVDGSVTEITVGGAFLHPTRCSALSLQLTPALFVAARVCRVPDAEHIVVHGVGGGAETMLPVYPSGLRTLPTEQFRSTQTALRFAGAAPALGAPVVFRPENVGPTLDRFDDLLLIDQDEVVERAATYRGVGITDR